MSKHLWLYEGVTEYFAGHMQVYEGLISVDDYLQIIKQKINSAKNYNDDISFTEMSKGVLDKYEDQYMNVYQKGALIGMSLDILLRKYSNGKMGLVDLMHKLGEKYGKDKSFKDDELIDVITELTYPEIGEFLKTYVDGNKPLPLDELFEMVGISYVKNRKVKTFTLGGIALGYNPETERLEVMDTGGMNEFGKAMKYKVGDEIVSINGEKLTMENYKTIFNKLKDVKEGDKITVIVARRKRGKDKLKKLSAKAMLVEKEESNILEVNPNATPEQVALRKAWLGQ
jgi:predicted metalloprotease with PDZ domain